MSPPKENALTGFRAINTASCKEKYKRFPAFGKLLMKLRRVGKVPSQIVMIVFDWNVARVYPRIVIPDEIPLDELEFTYLTGLPVQIVYHGKDARRVNSVVQAIMKVKPSFLATFGLDLLDTGESRMLIKPYKEILNKEVA